MATYARCVPSGERATAGPLSNPANCWPGGSAITERLTGRGGVGFRFQVAILPTPRSTKPAKLNTAAFRQPLAAGFVSAAADLAASELPSAIHFNSRQRSLVVCQRSSGSFARQTFTTRSSAGGVMGWSEEMGGGLSFKIAPITLAELFPSKAFFP